MLYRNRWLDCAQPPGLILEARFHGPEVEHPLTWEEARSKLEDIFDRYPHGTAEDELAAGVPDSAYPFVSGGSFVLDAAANPEPVWGSGEEVLMAEGEALIIAGGQGLGKSTLAQQLAMGRCGLPDYGSLLDYPIRPGTGRVLYLAMDRPRQIARSLRRMTAEGMRAQLDARLVVWEGPPPADLAKNTWLLLDLCTKADADTVILDSLKDAALGLNDDEVGAGYNRARQTALKAGVQVIELHHNRKVQAGRTQPKRTLDDLYGSTWLSSGAGSVLLLTGAPGSSVVDLHHLKQPAGEVGPMKLFHDHETGRTTLWNPIDLVDIAAEPISAVDAAAVLFETKKPDANQKKKAERRLNALTSAGRLRVSQKGDRGSRTPTLWVRA